MRIFSPALHAACDMTHSESNAALVIRPPEGLGLHQPAGGLCAKPSNLEEVAWIIHLQDSLRRTSFG